VGPECGKECGLCDSHEVLYVHHGWRAEMMMEGRADCHRTAGLVIDSLYKISSGFKTGRGGRAN
jgi:hypothetical protein